MKMRKKIVIEEIIEDKCITFSFDEDTSVGLLYNAADKFRKFVFEQVAAIEKRDEEQKPSEEEVKED